MTNADKIRAMTDEELAELLGKCLESTNCTLCPIYDTPLFEAECCKEHEEDDYELPSCGEIIAMWLKQEGTA